ncbi:MAG: MBL fold metallo-hydrolase [Spirochaetaceae bacterium]|nr:MAG: MBL fold metallo-hydrolase [Spirochaetaceae bacterium]
MTVRIWGARGSRPTPLRAEQVRSKISAVVQRIQQRDIVSPADRERFLGALPAWLFGTVGGNTACLEIIPRQGPTILIDAGSGIAELSASMGQRLKPTHEFHIFFTHFHYDHVQGLPFFGPAYNPRCSVHFYSPLPGIQATLSSHMQHPFFPVTMEEKMGGSLFFHQLKGQEVTIGSATVRYRELNHPGRGWGYRIEEAGSVFVHASDVELQESDFEKTAANSAFFANSDALILDTQYTLGEAIEKYNWGHSSFSLGVDFATAWSAKRLYLFHHEPLYDDAKLHKNLQLARWYAQRLGNLDLEVYLSEEGMEISL